MPNKFNDNLPAVPLPAHVEAELASYRRSLLAANRSQKTVYVYLTAIRICFRYLVQHDMPTVISAIRREHIEAFIVEALTTHKPNTARRYYNSLVQFFKWMIEEGEIETSPMARMKPPQVPETPPDVLPEDYIKKLLKVCEGNGFLERRDTAVIRLFLDSGMRLSELANLKLEDINIDLNVAYVVGKFSRPRACPFGKKTAQALDRYLRARAKHKYADSDAFWLGREGPCTKWTFPQMLDTRAEQAELAEIHPHLFRHTFAHMWLDAGGQEGDLRMIGGWNSSEVMRRYGKKLAAERARDAHKRLSPGDRI